MKQVHRSIPFFSYVIFLVIIFSFTGITEKRIQGYNLAVPDAAYVLPDILLEISGAVYLSPNTLACVQDENGVIFVYDLLKKEITGQHGFTIDGDYEGIALVGKVIYVLRSDGTLFEIADYRSEKSTVRTYATGIPSVNNEGLCYDKENNRLLIAAKSSVGKGPELKDQRVIYSFDLKTKTLGKQPLFIFNVQSLKDFAIKNNVKLEMRAKKNGKPAEPLLRFRPSAIAIHPVTKKLFLLSAADHILFIFNMNGNIEHIEPLDAEMFNKSEGITFGENADMLITNEGQYKKPTLLRFNYKK
ncbi:MAG TPA: hypothetical protein VF868_09080 [Bacteroidia bacterium]|jgi:hypothetical protein